MKLYNKFIFSKIKNNRQNYIKKYNKRNPRSRIIYTKLYSQRMMQKNYSEIVKDTQDQEKQKIRSLTGKQNRKSLVSCKACYLIGSHQKFLFLSCLKLLTVRS